MIQEFVKRFSEEAHKRGVTNLEFRICKNYKAKVEVLAGSVYQETVGEIVSCTVRGESDGMEGSINIEDFAEERIEDAIRMLVESAEISKKKFVPLELKNCSFISRRTPVSTKQLARRLEGLEEGLKTRYEKFKKFSILSMQEELEEHFIQNDRGIVMEESQGMVSLFLNAEAEKDGGVQTANYRVITETAEKMTIMKIAEEAVKEATDLLEAQPIAGGKYPVILKNKVLCEMLSIFFESFGAENIHKKMSKYNGRVGEKVVAECITILEDPNCSGGVNQRHFDDEGVFTQKKIIIKDGILKRILYNREEAEKDGAKSTGNGFSTGKKPGVGTGVTNLLFVNGEHSVNELMVQMQNGLYITECDGMFAGADPVSGDFSLISKGYVVEGGKPVRGVSQIAVAGNYFDILEKAKALADDRCMMKTDRGSFAAPTIYAGELVVSGK